jgi:hypothetical protein
VQDEDCAQVVAMQFAGGMSLAKLAEEWERDPAWVEEAIRRALLEAIPQRDGGLKMPRSEERAARSEEVEALSGVQRKLNLWT